MKIFSLFFILFFIRVGFAQPILNESYSLGADGSIFSSIIATDSCYYVSGMQYYNNINSFQEGVILRFNFDGTLADTIVFESDTAEFVFWESTNLMGTLDKNLAQTFTIFPENGHPHFGFLKIKPDGDTLVFNTYLDIYNQNQNDWVLQPGGLIQNSEDSSYYGTVNISTYSNSLVGVALFKLDKYGNFLWHKKYYGVINNFDAYKANSLLKMEPTKRLVIGGYKSHIGALSSQERHNTKIIITDSLGNIYQTKVFPNDILSPFCKGLTQTKDNGFLYAGANGYFDSIDYTQIYKCSIVKLDSFFNEEWRIETGYPFSLERTSFENIIPTSDTTFVAVGRVVDTTPNPYSNNAGYLVKFNIQGEIIWERTYLNVLTDSSTTNFPEHNLYNVSLTIDSGFAMVGQVVYYLWNDANLLRQEGWLLKADKYGCLVPGCQQYDDLGINPSLVSTIGLKTYPNPANNELYIYYANQNHSNQVKGVLFNNMGQQIMQFSMPTNHTTYMMNVSTLNKGMYILKVFGEDSEQVEKIMIE